MNSKLYVFGCSYATGEELLCHELPIDDYRIKFANDPRKFFYKLETLTLQDKYEEIKIRQKQLSWPNLLADKLGVECINLSESGNSLDKIVYQVLENNYKFNKRDMIIVSLTKPTRNAVFDSTVESFQLPSLMWPVKTLMGVKDTGDVKPVIDKDTDKALLKWFTNDRVAWDFVKNIQVLEKLDVCIVPAMKDTFTTSMLTLQRLFNSSKEKFLTQSTLDDFCQQRHAWGHPDKEAHEKYAEHIYGLLR